MKTTYINAIMKKFDMEKENGLIQFLHSTKDLDSLTNDVDGFTEFEVNIYYDDDSEELVHEYVTCFGVITKRRPLSIKEWYDDIMSYEDFDDYFTDYYENALSGWEVYQLLKKDGMIT